jgi:hypothetical protein
MFQKCLFLKLWTVDHGFFLSTIHPTCLLTPVKNARENANHECLRASQIFCRCVRKNTRRLVTNLTPKIAQIVLITGHLGLSWETRNLTGLKEGFARIFLIPIRVWYQFFYAYWHLYAFSGAFLTGVAVYPTCLLFIVLACCCLLLNQ